MEDPVALSRQELKLYPTPHPDRPSFINNLAVALRTRFERSGRREDLDEAISLHRNALLLLPAAHPRLPITLHNLAVALYARFKVAGRREDLNETISLHRDVIKLRAAPHPDRSESLNNLGNALQSRFDHLGQREDLEEALSSQRDALELRGAPNPDRYRSLTNIANALQSRFRQSGQIEDLGEAISLQRNALELCPVPHPHRFLVLNNLANALWTRFGQSSQREDLDEAIFLHRDALGLFPAFHPHRSDVLNNLANAIWTRFGQRGQQEDLEEAISLHRDALKLFPATHPHRSHSLNNLANSLFTRFKHSNRQEDLEEAILMHRDALELLTARNPRRSRSLSGLAGALQTRFEKSNQPEDLEEAIVLHREALELRAVPHPDRSESLNNLANALHRRFEQSCRQEDLEEAVLLFRDALSALPVGHPLVCTVSVGLGKTLMRAYAHTLQSMHFEEAIGAFRNAVTCKSAPTSERFEAALTWAHHSDHTDRKHDSALEAYQAAIGLLPRLAMLSLDLKSRHQALSSGSNGLARNAASSAIGLGHYDKAIELLEEGRAVFWSQALQLRTSMARLHDEAPELEKELNSIALALEQGSLRSISRNLSDAPQKVMSMEKEASYFHHLDDKWLAALETVRELDGFQDFLRPSRISTLQAAAVHGPVVILNTSHTGSDALIMTLTSVQHIPLLDLGISGVNKLLKLLQIATSSDRYASLLESNQSHLESLVHQAPVFSRIPDLGGFTGEVRHLLKRQGLQMQPDDIFHYVLAVLWVYVAEPVIRALNLKKTDTPPNLWWCPAGPFAFLPVHAAGLYYAETTEDVSNYVVSSYTPTISALLSSPPPITESFKMMVVIQPQTLPFAAQELEKIRNHLPSDCLIQLGIPGVPASVERVVLHLSDASIAHFACHGQQNVQSPLDSALFLEDGHLHVSQIMAQSIPNASLAFLCACETAMGDENLPDEAIHLGATLLFAGFHGVIATMWSISDADGPKIADAFYEHLFPATDSLTTVLDTTQAAQALHSAVAKLRAEKISFKRWVPFIHLGR